MFTIQFIVTFSLFDWAISTAKEYLLYKSFRLSRLARFEIHVKRSSGEPENEINYI